jgi:hypothetical protein
MGQSLLRVGRSTAEAQNQKPKRKPIQVQRDPHYQSEFKIFSEVKRRREETFEEDQIRMGNHI